MSEKFVHAVLNHGEHSAAFCINTFITVDELMHFACKQWRSLSPLNICFSYMDTNQVVFIQGDIKLQGLDALVIQMNNEDFYLNVDVIPKHTGCSTSSREFVGGVKAVRIVVDQYNMCTGYKILILKNDKTRFTAKCEEDGCGWRIHFGPVNGDISRFVLKDSNVIHSIQGDPTLKPKQIMSLFKKTYGSNIKYHHARRGKEAVFEDQYGDDEKSYSDLNWYLRPMIYLDATFLIGRFRGTLMAATCVNGNDGFYPYAFAIVLSENKDNWAFQEHFLVHITAIAFTTSSAISLLEKVMRITIVIDLFYKAAYSYTAANFEEALRGMHAIGCGHVANYLRTIPKEKWANAFFPVCRYAAHSSSIAESFNNWILEFKKLCFCSSRCDTFWFDYSKRRVEGLENFNTRLTPVYEDLLNENINIGRTWTVVESMERLYEVRSPRTHSVDLLERTSLCTPCCTMDATSLFCLVIFIFSSNASN
ncbi:uncharacterized protein LOC113331045 [Papaver somniferum]|uniref:uncharacterized protein LOC113331045 n=1 Tax=Papaver somniferum TaxID=3469 RepID=UPI000E7058F7|nr:uncharacterized protein LOC113331045 [Papaver somniferum]